jgi:hypothetical protein
MKFHRNLATFLPNSNSMKRVAIDSSGICKKNIQLKGQINPVSKSAPSIVILNLSNVNVK